jgi:hypothetical protein
LIYERDPHLVTGGNTIINSHNVSAIYMKKDYSNVEVKNLDHLDLQFYKFISDTNKIMEKMATFSNIDEIPFELFAI